MNYEKLLHKNKYQVFLSSCPAVLPFSFGIIPHYWFLVNNNGRVSRWEVSMKGKIEGTKITFLWKDKRPPTNGIKIFPFIKYTQKFHWAGKLIHFIEGERNSSAEKMTDFICASPIDYPFKNHYNLLCPNSNTFACWVLTNFPDFGYKLPFWAIGKNFKPSSKKTNIN